MQKQISLIAFQALILIAAPFQNKVYSKGLLAQSSNVPPASRNLVIQDGSYLKCKLNGKDWVASEIIPDKYVSEIVQIQGVQGTNNKTLLWLQLNKPAPGKTDALIETDLNNWTDEKYNMYMIKTGKTLITKMDDKWIEGTFSFTAQDNRSLKKIEVTDGSFRVPNPKSFKQ